MSSKASVKTNNVSKKNNNLIITKKEEKKENKLNKESGLYKGPVGTFFTKNKKKKNKIKLHYPKDYFDEYSRKYLGVCYRDYDEKEYQQDQSDYESDYNESEEEIESTENIGRRYWN